MKTVIVLAVAFLIGGCATPIGKLTDADFYSREFRYGTPLSQAVSAFYEGLRYCGPESDGLVFVTHYGVPICGPMRPDGSVTCDMHFQSMGASRNQSMFGRAEFFPDELGTRVKFGVKTWVAARDKILNSWAAFARGEAKTVCPG